MRRLVLRRAAKMHEVHRTYHTGDVIVRQGDTSMSVYVVLSGRVRGIRATAGAESIEVEYGAGSVLGGQDVRDDLPQAATIVALEPTECAVLAKWDLQRSRLTRTGGA